MRPQEHIVLNGAEIDFTWFEYDQVIVLKMGNKTNPIGTCLLDIKSHKLFGLLVLEPYQNQGLGTLLIKKMEEKAIILGIDNIWSNTDMKNKAAQSIFEKSGYHKMSFYEKNLKADMTTDEFIAPR